MTDIFVPVSIQLKDSASVAALEQSVRAVQGFEPVSSISEEADGGKQSILVAEIASDGGGLESLAQMKRDGVVRDVFVCCETARPELLLTAMRLGIEEFLPLPLAEDEFKQALIRFREKIRFTGAANRDNGHKVHVISVVGAKAGTGATSLAVNLADSCNRGGQGTLLVDMARPLGEVPLFLDMETEYTWGDAFLNLDRLDPTYLMSIIARHESGLNVLAGPRREEEAVFDAASADTLFSLLDSMFDVIVVDAPRGYDTPATRILELSDDVVLTSMLALPCLAHVKRFTDAFSRRTPNITDRISLVMNRYDAKLDISLEDAQGVTGLKTRWTLPEDLRSAMAAVNRGQVFAEAAPKSALAKAVPAMATELVPAMAPKKQRKGLFSFMKRRRHGGQGSTVPASA